MSVLSDKVAIITGASSGIGRAMSLVLARRGARVVLAARRLEKLKQTEHEIIQAGGHALAIGCDVVDRAQVKEVARRTVETFGQIDVLVNNAGVMPLAPLAKCRFEDWDLAIDVNLKGALNAIGAVLPSMLERKRGHIINIGSVAGHVASPTAAVYCATKFALHALSDSLRMELAQRAAADGGSIRVTVVAPGVVTTELRESIADEETRRALQPYYDSLREELTSEDVAAAVLAALEAPPHVGINEILLRPVSQVR